MEQKLAGNPVNHGNGPAFVRKRYKVKNAQGDVGGPVEKTVLFVCAPRDNVTIEEETTPLTLQQETEARELQCYHFMQDYPDWKDCPTIIVIVYTFEEVRKAVIGFFAHRSGVGSRARKSLVIYLGHGDAKGNLLLHSEKEPVQTQAFILEIDKALRCHYQQARSEAIPEIVEVLLTQCNSHKLSKCPRIHVQIKIKPLSSHSEPATNYDIETRAVKGQCGQCQEIIDSSHTEMSAFAKSQSCGQLCHLELSRSRLGLNSASNKENNEYQGYGGQNVSSAHDRAVTSGNLNPKAHSRSLSDGNEKTISLQLANEYGEKEHGIRQLAKLRCTTSHSNLASLLPSKRTFLESSKDFSAIDDNMENSWTGRLNLLGRSTNPHDSSFDLSSLDMSFTSSSSLQMFDSFDIAERGEYMPHRSSPSGLAARTGPANPIDGSNSSAGNSMSSSSLVFDERTARKDHNAGVSQPQDVPEWDSGYASPCFKENKSKGLDDQHRADKKTFLFEGGETKKLKVFASRGEPTSSAEAKPVSHTANTQRVTTPTPQRPASNVTDNVEYPPREEATNANLKTPESTGAAATRVTHSTIDQTGKNIKGNTPVTSTDSGVGSSGKLYMFPAHKLNL